MAVFAYARVSTADQTLDPQLDALLAAGVPRENILSDAAVSGVVRGQDRPGLAALLGRLQPGDVLTVVRLDRLGRSVVDVLQQVEALGKRGVVVRAIAEGVDSSTPAGRMVLGVLASLASYERELTKERQRAGIDSARTRGKHLGRPQRLNAAQRAHATKLVREGAPFTAVAEVLGCSVSTVRRGVRKDAARA